MEYLFVKTPSGLKPADELATDALRRFKLGSLVRIEMKQPRNLQFHKKFFAMLQIVLDNQEYYKSNEDVLTAVCVGIGHCTIIIGPGGVEMVTRKSISFTNMDNTEFSALYDRCVEFVTTEIIPGLEAKDLHEAVMELSGF